VLAVRSEAADEVDVKQLWVKVKAEIGVIDVLICNAGVLGELPDFPVIGKRKPSDWWSDMVGHLYIRGTMATSDNQVDCQRFWALPASLQLSSAVPPRKQEAKGHCDHPEFCDRYHDSIWFVWLHYKQACQSASSRIHPSGFVTHHHIIHQPLLTHTTEHPSLRVFSIHPGLVQTQMQSDIFASFAIDPREFILSAITHAANLE
jgi:hypothetical protein